MNDRPSRVWQVMSQMMRLVAPRWTQQLVMGMLGNFTLAWCVPLPCDACMLRNCTLAYRCRCRCAPMDAPRMLLRLDVHSVLPSPSVLEGHKRGCLSLAVPPWGNTLACVTTAWLCLVETFYVILRMLFGAYSHPLPREARLGPRGVELSRRGST